MDRLRLLRRAAGETQQHIANMLGIDRSTYTKYETSVSEPNIATLCRLAEHFGVTIDYLLGYTDNPTGVFQIESLALNADTAISDLTEEEKGELLDFARFLLSKRERRQG